MHLPGTDHRAGQRERPRHPRPAARNLPEPWPSMLAHSHPEDLPSITGTARFVPATFYIASLPFQDALQNAVRCGAPVADYVR